MEGRKGSGEEKLFGKMKLFGVDGSKCNKMIKVSKQFLENCEKVESDVPLGVRLKDRRR
jgi:hypothetical protein